MRDEAGAAAAWAVIWLIGCMMIGGLAVDAANAYGMKSRLQSVADASALAAVMKIDDREAARAAAVSLAERNMPPARHGHVIQADDVQFGVLDPETGAFVQTADDEQAEAVRIVAGRTLDRGNAVPTYLLRLMGPSEWELGAASTARTAGRATTPPPPPPDTETGADCPAATILSTGFVDTGGGNELGDGTCIYGEEGVQTGGDDCFETGAHIVAPDADDITINSPRCGEEEDIVVEETIDPVLLPKIHGGMFEEIYQAVNSNTKHWGDNQSMTEEQLALLPERFIGAQIVRVSMGWWTAEPYSIKEMFGMTFESGVQDNTIYLVDHGMQFAGGVDAENVAFIVNGQIGVGGGPGLKFDNVFFFGKGQLNFSGDVMWGTEGAYCENGEYSVYLFSEQSLSLGGFGPDTGAYGVMAAAPRFSPGGAMKNAGGLYIETEGWTSLGGAMKLTGCDAPLASMFDEQETGDATASDGTLQDAIDDLIDGAMNGDSDAVADATGAVLGASLVQ